MATTTRPNSYTTGTTIQAAQVNSDFNTLYNDYNGNITNANIAAAAAIVDTKLATIATASKVNVTALTAHTFYGSFTRDMTAATGTQVVTGIGFTPKGCVFFANVSGKAIASWGVDDTAAGGSVADDNPTATDTYTTDTVNSVNLRESGTQIQMGRISSTASGQFTFSWTKAGVPSAGTATIVYLAFG